MEVDEFEATTQAFLSWLSQMGVVINPSMALVDMRSEGRGRGASKSSILLLYGVRRSTSAVKVSLNGIYNHA
jgi:hypothetical protein